MSFFDDLWKSLQEQLNPFPGPSLTKKQKQQGPLDPANAPGLLLPNPSGPQSSKTVASAGSAISSTTDFLSYIAWIVYPANLLRAVEFFTGITLMGVGITLLTKRQGGVTGNVARRIVSLTPAGRTIRTLEGRRMGRHEGQREAARMQARQEETYSARMSSANERERINRNARQA